MDDSERNRAATILSAMIVAAGGVKHGMVSDAVQVARELEIACTPSQMARDSSIPRGLQVSERPRSPLHNPALSAPYVGKKHNQDN